MNGDGDLACLSNPSHASGPSAKACESDIPVTPTFVGGLPMTSGGPSNPGFLPIGGGSVASNDDSRRGSCKSHAVRGLRCVQAVLLRRGHT
jgi:hypothetical protein